MRVGGTSPEDDESSRPKSSLTRFSQITPFWVGFTLCFILALIIERCFEMEFLKSGAEVNHYLEKTWIQPGFTWASQTIGYYWKYGAFTFVAVIISAESGFKLFILYQVGDFINTWLKMVYMQARPQFLYPEQGDSCMESLGMPSGHAMQSFLLYVGAGYFSAIGIINGLRLKSLRTTRVIYAGLLILGAIMSLIVGLARLFSGKHSYVQVLFGWAEGFILFNIILHHSDHLSFSKYGDSWKYWLKRFTFWTSFLIVGYLTYLCVEDWTLPKEWAENLSMICDDPISQVPEIDTFQDEAFNNTSKIFTIIGADVALLLVFRLNSYLESFHEARAPYKDLYWHHLPFSSREKVATLLTNATIVVLWMVIFAKVLGDWLDGDEDGFTKNSQFYWHNVLFYSVLGFCYFSVVSITAILLYPIYLFSPAQNVIPDFYHEMEHSAGYDSPKTDHKMV